MRVIYEITQVDLRLANLLTHNYANVCHYLHFLLLFCESIFSSDGFLSTTHKLTPHIKGEKSKKKKKKNSISYNMRPTSILQKKEKRKEEKKEARPTHGAAVQNRPTVSLDLVGHRRFAQLRHPSLPARLSRGFGVTHIHLLRRISNPFKVNFQNLGFSFESKNDFLSIRIEF
jgi:hypothetical protein